MAALQFFLLTSRRRMDRLFVFHRLLAVLNLPIALSMRRFSLGIGLLVIVALNVSVIFLLFRALRDDVAVLSQTGLAKSLSEVLTEPLKLPTVVAMSREVEVNDPDNPRYYWDVVPPGPGQQPVPDTKRVWITEYLHLNTLEHDKALLACLASAALPFGIVPPVVIDGKKYVDGGLTDNVPVFPFINDPEVLEIYIILLEPAKSWEHIACKIGFDKLSWSNKDRAARVAEYPIETQSTFAKNKPPKIVPFRMPQYFPRPILLRPKRCLGNFLSGTLNFDGGYAQQLIDEGYEDTLAALGST
jgi:hypothetical protein